MFTALLSSRRVFLAAMLVALAPPYAAAQTATAGGAGVVLDPQGAIAPGAVVTLRHVGTGFERLARFDLRQAVAWPHASRGSRRW
ncbi:hypothetical protein BH23ACI1_BH23ACI1_17990 [soil metagenome]